MWNTVVKQCRDKGAKEGREFLARLDVNKRHAEMVDRLISLKGWDWTFSYVNSTFSGEEATELLRNWSNLSV